MKQIGNNRIKSVCLLTELRPPPGGGAPALFAGTNYTRWKLLSTNPVTNTGRLRLCSSLCSSAAAILMCCWMKFWPSPSDSCGAATLGFSTCFALGIADQPSCDWFFFSEMYTLLVVLSSSRSLTYEVTVVCTSSTCFPPLLLACRDARPQQLC